MKDHTAASLLGLTSLALASLVLATEAEPARVFSHRRHLAEGADCDQCHAPAAERPGTKLAGCTDCHEAGPPPWRLPARAGRTAALAFPHARHAARVGCADCHAATLDDRPEGGRPMVAYEACQACHRDQPQAEHVHRCEACHGLERTGLRPASHLRAGFQRGHGALSRAAEDAAHGRGCRLCHRASQCDTCHRTTRPADHTALWRLRTHGLAAGWDRESCKTCHESGACLHCHRTTRPLNHTASWGATHGLAAASRADARCAACHPLGYCAACHAGR